jgi:hypothetical protein
MMQMQCDLDGNAYAIKEFNARGNLTALWPVGFAPVTVLKSVDGANCFIASI